MPSSQNNSNSNPTNNNKKVLNIFHNLLNRNKSSNNSFNIKHNLSKEINNSEQETVLASQKILKRTISSSTQFLKSKPIDETTSHVPNTLTNGPPPPSLPSSQKSIFNPVTSLFSSKSSKYNIGNGDKCQKNNVAVTSSNSVNTSSRNKYRRSLDDIITSNSGGHQIRLDKFENTTFSTKNNGLIFIPSPPKLSSQQQQKQAAVHETIHENEAFSSIYENLENLNTKPTEIIYDNENQKVSTTTKNAFENEVYNYYDAKNLRQSTKRCLSDLTSPQNRLTMMNNNNNKQPQQQPCILSAQIQHNASFSSTYSSSTTSSSSSSSSNYSTNLKSPVSFNAKQQQQQQNLSVPSQPPPSLPPQSELKQINNNNSSVLSLREKFEHLNTDKNSNKKDDLTIVLATNSSLSSSQCMQNAMLNSPALSSISSNSSSSSSSRSTASSTTCSSLSLDLQQHISNSTKIDEDDIIIDEQQHVNDVKTHNNNNNLLLPVERTIIEEDSPKNEEVVSSDLTTTVVASPPPNNSCLFFFYYDFFRTIKANQSTENNNNNNKLYENYKNILTKIFKSKSSASTFIIEYILDPLINNDLISSSPHKKMTENSVSYKFSVEFFRSIYLAKTTVINNNNNRNNLIMNVLRTTNPPSNKPDDINLEIHNDSKLESFNLSDDFSLNQLYDYFKKELKKSSEQEEENDGENVVEQVEKDCKTRLRSLLESKLNYFNQEMNNFMLKIDENNRIGLRILKQLEDNLNVTLLELDKYKLLISESDVIMSLLLKLCNKMALLENCMQIVFMGAQLKSENGVKKCSDELVISFFC